MRVLNCPRAYVACGLVLLNVFLFAATAVGLDWTPRLRQLVKLHFAVRCRSVVGRG